MGNSLQNSPRMTAEEYYKAESDLNQPTELIGGEIFALASPSLQHQCISGRLFAGIDGFIHANHGNCAVYQAIDVQLSEEDVVVPDVAVICEQSKLNEQHCIGAPDWVIEITSTNRSNDFDRKLYLYRMYGVREYWIVDTMTHKVWVYCFEKHPNVVGFYDWADRIPVGIYGGKLEIRIADLL